MGNVIDAIKTRRSIRKYKQDPIPQEKLDRILEAALYSPSGIGKQSPIMICVQNKELRDRIEKMNSDILVSVGRNGDNPFFGAPVVVVVLADRKVPTHVEDGSIVCSNIMLAAYEEGLGSCWINRAKEEFDSEEGKAILKELGIEGDYRGVGHVVLGYADCDLPNPAPRKEGRIHYVK